MELLNLRLSSLVKMQHNAIHSNTVVSSNLVTNTTPTPSLFHPTLSGMNYQRHVSILMETNLESPFNIVLLWSCEHWLNVCTLAHFSENFRRGQIMQLNTICQWYFCGLVLINVSPLTHFSAKILKRPNYATSHHISMVLL